MLAPAYNAIKAVNSNIIVISGAPAPTGFDNTTNAWADNRYIAGMRAAGAANYVDQVLQQQVIANGRIVLRVETTYQGRVDQAKIVSRVVINFRAAEGVACANLQPHRAPRAIAQLDLER